MIPFVKLKQNENLRRYNESWLKDINSFYFSCGRFGNFLHVYIERNHKKDEICVNLNTVHKIELILGNKPEKTGIKEFYLCVRRDEDCALREEYSYHTKIRFPDVDLSNLQLKRRKNITYNPNLGVFVDEIAVPSESDRIIFNYIHEIPVSGNGGRDGINHLTIHTPFSLGKDVYRKILWALGEGGRVEANKRPTG